MTESPNFMAPNNSQFYGILNEPLPPTPLFRQQQQPIPTPLPSMFASKQQCSPTSVNYQEHQQLQQQRHSPAIVGPSDHYGINHQFNGVTSNDNNNHHNHRASSAKQNPLFIHSPSQSQNETKVCVIVDSRTPVILKIQLPPSQVTLADLKLALPAIDQPNYKYFFKSNDREFGIVKEEIQEDDCVLPTYRNRVVAWIVTPGRHGDEVTSKTRSETDTCNLTYSNTSYDDGSSSLMTTDIDSTSYFTETDDDSISCSSYSQTTCEAFISKNRNNRSCRNGGKSPVNHYQDRPHQSSTHSPHRFHNHSSQHDGGRNLDNISPPTSSPTSSSASDSDATAVHCLTVHLVLTNENFLGLHIYANAVNGVDEGIYVDGVTENSAVALDGRIEPGDKLIQVNETNLEELSNEEAVRVLKDAVIKRGPLRLVVAKFIETNKNDAMDGIIGPKEAIHPIDTAAWVAHAQAITIPNIQDQANSATSSPSFGSNAQDTDCIRPASAGVVRLNTGLRLNRGTSDIKEIVEHMRMPGVGLETKDREWLKIQIPKAFLGSDLITWLERNVYSFNSSRDAKKFASRMLKEGYIRDPISKKSFSSKSYYTLQNE